MKRHLLAIILLASLALLTLVQFRLLRAGVLLEKQRFDLRTEEVLLAVADSLNQPGIRSSDLIERLKANQLAGDTQLVLAISDSLDLLIAGELQKKGIHADFAFAFTPEYTLQPLLTNRNFRPDKFAFNRYKINMGSHIIGSCHFMPVLHFDVPNLFGYLLGVLRNLVITSVLCLLAILSCFLLLLNILNKERKLNAIKNDFINNLTHELKTPAFSISLSSKMAKESLAKNDLARTGKFLQLIDNENNKIKTHVEKVLELASLENPRYNLHKTAMAPRALLEEVAAEFAPAINDRGGTLTMQLPPKAETLMADTEHLKNALRNLLDNAIKYSIGKPVIGLSLEKKDACFQISVSDKGPGIAPVYQRKVFDKFFRIPTGEGQAKGFGLGLSYVFQIAKAHGGKVVLESEEGIGSRFTIVLPI